MPETNTTRSLSMQGEAGPACLMKKHLEGIDRPCNEERFRTIVELAPDGISVHYEGRFEFINPAGTAILGAASGAELLGRPILEFVHADYHQVFSERLALLEERRVELPWMEEKFLRCDGSEVDVEVTAVNFTLDGKAGFQTIFRDITQRKAAELRLERMANYDLLTGLPSRSLFFDRLNQLMLHAKRDASRFALLFIDLDRFEEANDRLGHYFGDLLLKEVALRLTSCVRESDTVARIGEDGFVVILSRLSARVDVATLAQRITESIGQPLTLLDRECSLDANIGISLFPRDGETCELLLAKAETARLRGKLSGSTSYQFYSPESEGPPVGARLTRSAAHPSGRMPPTDDLAQSLAS